MSITDQMQEITKDLKDGTISDEQIVRIGELIQTHPKAFEEATEPFVAMAMMGILSDPEHLDQHVFSAVNAAFTLGVLYGREHHRRGYNL